MSRLLPFPKGWQNLLAAAPVFLAGAYFDLTAFRME